MVVGRLWITALIISALCFSCDMIGELFQPDDGGTEEAGGEPAAPANLMAMTMSSERIDLSWKDKSNNETGFAIERSVVSGSSDFTELIVVDDGTISHADTGLLADTEYWYRVRAVNDEGYSAYTSTAAARTTSVAAALPSAPDGLAAVAKYIVALDTHQIRLTWNDNSSDETGFEVQRSTTSESEGFSLIVTAASSATAYIDGDCDAGTQYWYRVRAVNTTGASAYTAVITATPGSTTETAPFPPDSLAVEASSADTIEILLSWTDNSLDETGFEVERSTTSGAEGFSLINTTASDAAAFTDKNCDGGTQYWYRVRAVNDAGYSAYTSVVNITPRTTTQPPQTVKLYPQYDNTVKIANWDTSMEKTVYSTGELQVGIMTSISYLDTNYTKFAALLKFDTSSLIGKSIDSATLTLTSSSYGNGDAPRDWVIKAMKSSWNPNNITMEKYISTESYLEFNSTQDPPGAIGHIYSINVKTVVQNWADGTWMNNGFNIVSINYTVHLINSIDSFGFYSKETNDESKKPTLTVSYH